MVKMCKKHGMAYFEDMGCQLCKYEKQENIDDVYETKAE